MAELKKSLGYGTIIALSITTMIGTGLFMGPAIAASLAGPMSIISWVILSLMTLYVTLCFGELVSMFPNSGGVYEFAKQAYGSFISFMVGWITWLVTNITTCVVVVASIKFLVPATYTLPIFPNMSTELFQVLFAIFIIIILNYIAYRGIDTSSKVLIFFATMTILVLLFLIVPGLINIELSNFQPFFKKGAGSLDISLLIFMSLFWILETYFGWESATFLAEETKDARKIIPWSQLITTLIVTTLGTLLAFVMLGNIGSEALSVMAQKDLIVPLKTLSSLFYPESVWIAVKIGIFITLIGSAAGCIVSTPRMLLALARDKLFINRFSDIHERYQTPYKAIMFQTLVTIVIVIIGFGEYQNLLSMLVPLALIMYISVLLSVTFLRYKMPNMVRSFRAPFGKVGPVLISGLYISIIISWLLGDAQIGSIDPHSIFRLLLSFIFLGAPIYLLLLFYYDPDIIVKLNDFFAYFTLAFERLLIPKKIDNAVFEHIGDIRGNTILEFGCGVGTFTKELAREVGENGVVYATDVSYRQVRIANKRIAKRGHLNVRFIHDIHQVNRVHHSIPLVDSIVSIGMLGYLQDIKKVLREMHKILPENGKIFMIDYVDLFKIIPNVSWLANEDELIGIFRDCGFSVRIEKIKGAFWNYLFVYGIKTEHDVPFI